MSKNIHGKTRDVQQPYAVFVMGDWEWRVLKRYQTAENEKKNPYAVWFCAVQTPMTYGSWEYGDTYISDIPGAVAGQEFGADEHSIAVSIAG
jgi:hypothetical protein